MSSGKEEEGFKRKFTAPSHTLVTCNKTFSPIFFRKVFSLPPESGGGNLRRQLGKKRGGSIQSGRRGGDPSHLGLRPTAKEEGNSGEKSPLLSPPFFD